MQTNFFSNVPNSDGIQKKCFSILKNYFQLHGVLFETIQKEITATISKETASKLNKFLKNEITSTLLKGVLTLTTFGQICNVSVLQPFLSGFF